MNRVPEPELMNGREQSAAYSLADFTEPHNMFVRLFAENFPGIEPRRVLDLGCGPADICVRFAESYPESVIHGVDGAPNMLEFGRERLRNQDLTQRVQLFECFLPDGPLPGENYDTVLSNSLLHHLPSPGILWDCVKQCAAPGAAIMVMDLMRPENQEAAGKLVERYSAGEPEILKQDFFHSLCAAYEIDEVADQLADAGLAGLDVRVVSDRHFMVAGVI